MENDNDNKNDNEYYYSDSNDFKKSSQRGGGRGATIFLAFICGIIGAVIVIAICFGVPSIRENVLGITSSGTSSSKSSSNSSNSKYDATLMDIAEYSETSVAVAEACLPSVVGVSVTYNVASFGGTGTAMAYGSGVIISDDGYIITNNHVINSESSSSYYQVTEATAIKVHLYNDPDDTLYDAEIIGSDSTTDLAVLKIETDEALTAITIGDSDNLRIGEFVMAVGNPYGLDSSITCGVISALNREVTDTDGNKYITIQTDAAINAGNSGGALVNSKGELIGINSLKLSGSDIEGIGFAMPINSSMTIVNQLMEYGMVKRPYIGISGSDLTEELSKRYDKPVGVYVEEVYEGSPAESAGLKEGDIITKIDGQEITTMTELNDIKNTYQIGDKVVLTIYRKTNYKDIEVTLAETPEEEEEEQEEESYWDDFDSLFNLFNY